MGESLWASFAWIWLQRYREALSSKSRLFHIMVEENDIDTLLWSHLVVFLPYHVVCIIFCSLDCMLCSQPASECTSKVDMEGEQSSDIALKALSFAIALISMMIGTLNTARSSDAFSLGERYLDGDTSLYRIDIFYSIYMLAAGYTAMIFLAWDIAKSDAEQQLTMDRGIASTWAKMGASWLCALLYMWALVAHRILGKYRSFS